MQINQLFKTIHELKNLKTKLTALEELKLAVASKLDPNLAHNCTVSNIREGVLILTTTSPAWNHKLRFLALDLLSSLRADPRWCGLKSIEVKVDYLPNFAPDILRPVRRKSQLSADNATMIQQIAADVSHPKLSESLKRLARHSMLPSKDVDKQ